MMFDWSLVVEIALFCVVAICATVLVPWVKKRIGAEQFNALWKWICMAVQAAEQLFGSGTGERKKQYVLEFLAKNGVEADDQVDVLIEAAVRELTD